MSIEPEEMPDDDQIEWIDVITTEELRYNKAMTMKDTLNKLKKQLNDDGVCIEWFDEVAFMIAKDSGRFTDDDLSNMDIIDYRDIVSEVIGKPLIEVGCRVYIKD